MTDELPLESDSMPPTMTRKRFRQLIELELSTYIATVPADRWDDVLATLWDDCRHLTPARLALLCMLYRRKTNPPNKFFPHSGELLDAARGTAYSSVYDRLKALPEPEEAPPGADQIAARTAGLHALAENLRKGCESARNAELEGGRLMPKPDYPMPQLTDAELARLQDLRLQSLRKRLEEQGQAWWEPGQPVR